MASGQLLGVRAGICATTMEKLGYSKLRLIIWSVSMPTNFWQHSSQALGSLAQVVPDGLGRIEKT
jgi:hypothetical protein